MQIAVDDILRKRGGKERLKYMTHVSTALSACMRSPYYEHLLKALAAQECCVCGEPDCRVGKKSSGLNLACLHSLG